MPGDHKNPSVPCATCTRPTRPFAIYSQETVQLEPGDKLFLFSDGAEPFIGTVDEKSRFSYYESFTELSRYPVTEMLDRFISLTKQTAIDPGRPSWRRPS